MKRHCPPIVTAAVLVLSSVAAAPAQAPGIPAVRTAAAPVVDGRLDEAVWADAPVAEGFIQARPHPGRPATQRTEVRLVYDDQALYVAARMLDDRPDSVVATLARRDQDVYADWFTVSVDSYRDRRTAFSFSVNPRGVRRDVMLHDDTRQDQNWDAVWEAATARDADGWTAELRIPLSQLRYDARATERTDGATWGINFSRTLARRDELSYWAPILPEVPGLVSRFGELRGLRDLRPARRLELQPYSVARVTRAPGSGSDPFHEPTALFGSAGLDLKYGVTSDLTLSATFNPDFGQVEADPSQVNLSAFESYFSEKRPFFTEGSEILSTGWPLLLYSRRIGRAPQGRLPAGTVAADAPDATTILGAAKLTGKTAGGWSIGVLNALTGAEHARYVTADGVEGTARVEPLTNYAVARVVRDFNGGGSAVGAVVTATHRNLGSVEGLELLRRAGYAGGIDARHRFGGSRYEATALVRGSYVLGSDSAIARVQRSAGHYFQRPDATHLTYDPGRGALAGYAVDLGVSRIGGESWRWGVTASAVSPGFEVNDLGFHSGSDAIRQHAFVGYTRQRAGAVVRSWTANVGGFGSFDFAGERRDAGLDLYHELELVNRWGGSLWYMRHQGGISHVDLRGGPGIVNPGRHMGMVGVNTDPRERVVVRTGVYWEIEDGTGSSQVEPHLTASVRASDRLELSLRPALSRRSNTWQWVARREHAGSGHYLVGRLDQTTASLTTRLSYTFSPELSFQLYAQPFLSAGAYSAYRVVDDPRAERFDRRFRALGPEEISETDSGSGARAFGVDLDRDGSPDVSFPAPDFDVAELRSNTVLRWEYHRGSTLFVVWSQGRSEWGGAGDFALRRGVDRLGEIPATNVFLVKLSYWLGM